MANKSQLAVAVSMAFEVKPQLADTNFKLSAYARTVALDSNDSISEKTATNYATIAKKLVQKFESKMGIYEFTSNDVLLFTNFLTSEVASAGYTASLDDIGAYCDGKPSQKAKRAAAIAAAQAAAEAKAQAEAQAEAAKQTSAEIEAQAAEEKRKAAEAHAAKAQAEREAAEAQAAEEKRKAAEAEAQAAQLREEKAAAEAAAAQAEAEAEAAKAQAEAQAEAARKTEASTCITVQVNADGTPNIVFGLNMSPEFMLAVAREITSAAKALKAAQAASLKKAA
jgi:DNA repair exonuclease SbcCD ATPase subunit